MSENKYEQLKVAVQDLLCELRIGEVSLRIMAKGYSPSYPGGPGMEVAKEPGNVVQISQVVAQKLLDAGIVDE